MSEFSVFEEWRQAMKASSVQRYFHSESFSASGKTEKIVIPPKPGYDILGVALNVNGVVLTAGAAEAVVSGAKSLLDLLKQMKGRINNRGVLSLRNADIIERVLAYFANEDIVVASGRKASLLADFAGAGSATHYVGVILPFVVKDGEGQATLEWEWGAITDLFAADVTIAAHNWKLTVYYGHFDGQPFGIGAFKPSIVATGDKDLAVEMRGEAQRCEIWTGVGADTYVDNVDGLDQNNQPAVHGEGSDFIVATENQFLVTRATGEFVVQHAPVEFSSYLAENSHSSAITPDIIKIYDRTLKARTQSEKVMPETLQESLPVKDNTLPSNKALQTKNRSGFLSGLFLKK